MICCHITATVSLHTKDNQEQIIYKTFDLISTEKFVEISPQILNIQIQID